MMIRENIGRNIFGDERNGMIMNTMRRRKSLGGRRNILVFGDDTLEVRMHRSGLNSLDRVELGNNFGMTFFEEIFHSMGTDDLR
jgi:hypothetical protein